MITTTCDQSREGDCVLGLRPCWSRERRGVCRRVAQGDAAYIDLVRDRTASECVAAEPLDPDAWLAPARDADGRLDVTIERAWEGRCRVKPWHRAITAALVHVDTPELLRVAVESLRCQTDRPHIIVVDAGSHARHRDAILSLEADDVELVLLRPRAWRATSQAVAAAMDCAFALTQTEFSFATHVDVFLKQRDLLESMRSQCDANTPIVGYQMSERPAWDSDLWRAMPSHTATLYHMPTMRSLGVHWSMLAAFDRLGIEPSQPPTGWPDTEVNLGLALIEAGIRRWDLGTPRPAGRAWLCLGPEANEPYEDDRLQHVRSYTGVRIYGSGSENERREQLIRDAMIAQERRVARWRKPRVSLGAPHCVPCAAAAKEAQPTSPEA